jgi:hypothetical protein
MSYYEKVLDDDDVYTVEDFRNIVKRGGFIDYDGFGFPVKDGFANEDVYIKPSRIKDIPDDATHIVWLNR